MTRPLLTEAEALQLNRKQLIDRMNETQAVWARRLADDGLRRRPLSERERLDLAAFGQIVRRHLPLGAMLNGAIAYVSGAATPNFLLERVDGSAPRLPRRVKLSRRKGATMPVTAINCTRSGPYGNPFKVADYGDTAILQFAMMLHRRQLNPREAIVVRYPSDEQIRAGLGYWDLACWCDLPADDSPTVHDLCHADVLLRVAAGRPALHPLQRAVVARLHGDV